MHSQKQIEQLLEAKMAPIEEVIRQVTAEMRAIPEEEPVLLDAAKNHLRKLHREAHRTYIAFGFEHADCTKGLSILYSNRHRIERQRLQKVVADLAPSLQHTKLARSLRIFLSGDLVKVGQAFHDIEAQEISGKDFKLSSLIGKPILLTFWGGGCRGARMRNQWLSDHHETLKSQVQLVNFYLGLDKARWQQLSKEAEIHWGNISDLQGCDGAVKTRYDFQGVPTSILIDADGIVLAREREDEFGYDLLNSIETLLHSKPV
ncbi:MAG: TlpA family protein disulfide reductase [Saprospiraceae bacterium]|nr:TlpA family protein disulfide reductase [Saprospiraceae bacterium]